jgi:hypothetical protein
MISMDNRKVLLLFVLTFGIAGCNRERSRDQDRTHKESDTVAADSSTSRIHRRDTTSSNPSPDLSPDQRTSGWQTYTDSQYGFSIEYPSGLKVRKGFETVHLLSQSWRAMATPEQHGSAIISIPIARLQNKQSFPRYYSVDLRIGVSSGSASDCAASNGERSIGAIDLNGVKFDQYEFSDAAMMQYVSGISYRTDHLGHCFAIEQIRNGSSYADQPSRKDIPQRVLDSCYYLAGKIVKTFRFTK